VIFDDNWQNSWSSTDGTLATDQYYDGSTSLKLTALSLYSGFYAGRSNAWNTDFDPISAGYTHFEFKTRVGSKDGQRTFSVGIGIKLSNGTYVSLPGVDLSSALYSNEQPTTAARWSVVRVPLTELGLQSGMSFAGFYLAQMSGVKLLESWFDGIQLAAYSTSKFFFCSSEENNDRNEKVEELYFERKYSIVEQFKREEDFFSSK